LVKLDRVRYGVLLVFHGDRRRPYGLVRLLKLSARAPDKTCV